LKSDSYSASAIVIPLQQDSAATSRKIRKPGNTLTKIILNRTVNLHKECFSPGEFSKLHT